MGVRMVMLIMMVMLGCVVDHCSGNHQLCLVNSFEAREFRREGLHRTRFPPEHDDFHTEIMIEMDMQGRHDRLRVGMLNLEHFIGQLGFVMIVDESQTG